jgi:hypothetical protein
MTRISPVYAGGIRQNVTMATAATSYPLSAIPDAQPDDLVFLGCMFITLNPAVTALNGWTQLFLQNVGTRRWGLWYRRRVAGDTTYSTPTFTSTGGGGNSDMHQTAWRGVDWAVALVVGTPYSRASSITTLAPPSITVVAGSVAVTVGYEASNAVETADSDTFTAGWFRALGFADQLTASVSIEHVLTLFKPMPTAGATGTPTITWVNASANGAAVQIGLTGIDPGEQVSPPLDSTGIKYWDASTSTWIAASRGPKGPTGPTGLTGPAGSVLPKSLAQRSLSPGASLPQGWYDYIFDTVPGSQEVNPLVSSYGTTGFRFAKTGAYLVSAVAVHSVTVPDILRCIMLYRAAFDGGSWEVGRVAIGRGGTAASLTLPVLAHAADIWTFKSYKGDSGSTAHTTTVNISPLGPCRVREYDYAVILDHSDVSLGLTPGNTYTLAPRTGTTLTGDWVYLIHLGWFETVSAPPAPPQGFEVVVPLQTARTPGSNGIEWGVWRKKYVAGETYIVNLPATRYVHASLVSVRQPNDDKPILSPLVAPRQGVASSVVTVPGGVMNSTGLAISVIDTGDKNLTPPPAVSNPGVYGWSVPPEGPGPAASRTEMTVATLGPNLTSTGPVTFTWGTTGGSPVPDVGWIGGITLSWPRVAL